MKVYRKRIADDILLRKLEGKGTVLIEEGALSLKTLSARIDTKKMKPPAFLMVMTGTGNYAYRRSDGVYVVPAGYLKDGTLYFGTGTFKKVYARYRQIRMPRCWTAYRISGWNILIT